MHLFIHLFSGLAIKCYTGSKHINSPLSSYAEKECAPGLNTCFTAQVTTKFSLFGNIVTLHTIEGICIINTDITQCETYCNVLKETTPSITSCTVSNMKKNCF